MTYGTGTVGTMSKDELPAVEPVTGNRAVTTVRVLQNYCLLLVYGTCTVFVSV